eukprot:13829711-Alexandrium_andersonii.AAC.1
MGARTGRGGAPLDMATSRPLPRSRAHAHAMTRVGDGIKFLATGNHGLSEACSCSTCLGGSS